MLEPHIGGAYVAETEDRIAVCFDFRFGCGGRDLGKNTV